MNEKINAVMDVMCRNRQLISDVTPWGNEFFFRYKSHVMSIIYRKNRQLDWGPYSLYVYPDGARDLSDLAAELERANPEDVGVKMVTYHSSDYNEDSMKKLYDIVKERSSKVDVILDDILSDDCGEIT